MLVCNLSICVHTFPYNWFAFQKKNNKITKQHSTFFFCVLLFPEVVVFRHARKTKSYTSLFFPFFPKSGGTQESSSCKSWFLSLLTTTRHTVHTSKNIYIREERRKEQKLPSGRCWLQVGMYIVIHSLPSSFLSFLFSSFFSFFVFRALKDFFFSEPPP